MITKDPIELYLEKYLGIIKDVHNTIDGADSNYHYYQGVIDAIENVLVKLQDNKQYCNDCGTIESFCICNEPQYKAVNHG